MAYYRKVHLQIVSDRALGNRQGRATHVTALWLCVEESLERGQCCSLASVVLYHREMSPSTGPDASHFDFYPYATGALPVVSLVLNPRGSESV